jgi:hypothetical protein
LFLELDMGQTLQALYIFFQPHNAPMEEVLLVPQFLQMRKMMLREVK